MKFWPFPIIRLHSENKRVTKLFLMFARSKNLRITCECAHYITVTTEHGDMTFWNANKYYAWGCDGSYSSPEGRKLRWSSELPSRYAVRAMRSALEDKFEEAA